MQLASGVKEYLDCFINDDNYYVVLIYGSFASGRASSKSDIDIYIVGNIGTNYRECKEIDGCELEIAFTDVNYIDKKITDSVRENNAYFESLLNQNIILKDSFNLIDELKELLREVKKTTKKNKRKISPRMEQLLNTFYEDLLEKNDLYNYFNLLELIRLTLSYINNLSSLNIGKVYDMYSDKEHAKKDYYLTLPSDEFITQFDDAIRNPLVKNKVECLFDSIKFYPFINLRDSEFFKYCDNNRRKSILIHMDKMINKTIKLLVEDNPYKDYVYHVVLNHLYRFYNEIYGCVTEEFIKIVENAKIEKDKILRIDYLKHLFQLLEGKYAFDYKNYTLYLN